MRQTTWTPLLAGPASAFYNNVRQGQVQQLAN